MIVISLFDYTGEAVRPWAKAGYDCYCYDIQHKGMAEIHEGLIYYEHWNADAGIEGLKRFHQNDDIAMIYSFTPCTDLAVSGAKHFKAKELKKPGFQDHALQWALLGPSLADHFNVPYVVENPVSVLSTLWRKPDHIFHPYEYGGYIPESEGKHPKWPDYIEPFDAYTKKTCFWTGNGFKMPEPKPVGNINGGKKFSRQFYKLGGKSLKTKNIRSATPRGIARALFEANNQKD
jgi:hypothetical protein